MKHYAFDVDGTLSVSSGPVRIEVLQRIHDDGNKVSIVSPSAAGNDLPFIHWNTGPDRETNLQMAREWAKDADEHVYVSDNPGDDERAKMCGYSFCHPTRFVYP